MEGKLGSRKFTDGQNVARHITEIIVKKITLLGRRSDLTELEHQQQAY